MATVDTTGKNNGLLSPAGTPARHNNSTAWFIAAVVFIVAAIWYFAKAQNPMLDDEVVDPARTYVLAADS